MFFLFFEFHFPYPWRRKTNTYFEVAQSIKWNGRYHCLEHRKCHWMLVPSLPTPHYHLHSHPRGRGRETGGGTHFWMAPPQTVRLYFKIRKDVLPSPLPRAPQSPRELCAIGIPGKCSHLPRCSYLMMHLSGKLEKGTLCLENIFFPSPGKQKK